VKKRLTRSALLGLLACCAGCFSLESTSIADGGAGGFRIPASDGRPTEHVVVANQGWYLFNAWPIACGNASPGAKFACRFFHDDVRGHVLQNRLTQYAASRGCDIEELNVFNDEQVLLSIPGLEIPIPIPYIFTYRELQYSGVLVKRPPRRPPTPEEKRRRSITREMRLLLEEIPEGGAK